VWTPKHNEAGELYYEREDGRCASPYDVEREEAINSMSAELVEADHLTWEEKINVSMERLVLKETCGG